MNSTSNVEEPIFSYEIKNANYGPSIVAGRRSRLVHEQYPKTSKRFAEQIDYVASSLSDKNIKELEKLATALFVTMESTRGNGIEKRADRLQKLKPHVPRQEALQAVQTVDSMCQHRPGSIVFYSVLPVAGTAVFSSEALPGPFGGQNGRSRAR
ncbi:hypothetical protein SAMN05660653_02623 [Desulfonatronum thiosulfatophilum]|uniref:Uncharacterized protein n=1 Tax=Desulfonatronum thiosulfatophilum TaxID=617002 RepID=A0A1G6E6T4_9BACT|nr:hypothetical protein [Desulfonatronum thiosulfatophilum]SDB53072.1 hypothetical protein SAMN05660653_02623 [Desulfonatronum thiosulfatophilum]